MFKYKLNQTVYIPHAVKSVDKDLYCVHCNGIVRIEWVFRPVVSSGKVTYRTYKESVYWDGPEDGPEIYYTIEKDTQYRGSETDKDEDQIYPSKRAAMKAAKELCAAITAKNLIGNGDDEDEVVSIQYQHTNGKCAVTGKEIFEHASSMPSV